MTKGSRFSVLGSVFVFTFMFPASAQEPATIAPARAGLEPISLPPLEDAEPAVAMHVAEVRSALDRTAAQAAVSARDLAEAYGSLGRVLHAYEFFEPAEASYLNARRLVPGDGRWPHLLGFLYQQTGRLPEAATVYSDARRLQPNDRAAVVHLGEVYLGLNRLREAREQFEQVAEVFPSVARNGLGEVALREGRFAEAVDDFRAALDRAPQASSIHYSLAMAYRGLGRLDQARTHLQQRGTGTIRAADPLVDSVQLAVRGERALVMLGRRAYEAGQFQEAASAFRKALEAAPASATARVNLGLTLVQLGDAVGAIEQLQAALAAEPDDPDARATLGIVLARQGRDRDALSYLQSAFAQSPENAGVRAELVGVLLRLAREDEAIAVLTTSVSLDPDDEGALVSLSILLARHERYQDAIARLEEAYRRLPDRRPTATTLARLLASSPDRSLRNGRRALELATAVYGAEPSPAYAETVALALAELGRCGEAVEWMRRAAAEAERVKDSAEVSRLRSEMPKYQTGSCRQ